MNNIGKKVMVVTIFGVIVYAVFAFASDVGRLRVHLAHFAWWTFAAALGLAFANYLCRFLKWEYYLRRLKIGANTPNEPFRPLPMGESFSIFVSGFVMSITPGKAGEVFKSALLASARGVAVAKSAPIVVAERLTDLLSLILLVAIGSAFYPGWAWIALIAGGMVASALVFIASRRLAHFCFGLISRFRFGSRIAPKLEEAYESLRVMSSPSALVAATLVSVVAWGLECTGLWLVLRGVGTPVTANVAFFTYATATIAGAIAMLPGGLGGTELTMQQMLRVLGGVGTAAALAATLLIRIATLWFAVVVGFVALAVFRRRYDRQKYSGERSAGPSTPSPQNG